MRKNIFDLLQRDYNLHSEGEKIENLINHPKWLYIGDKYTECGIENFVNNYLFMNWEYRDTTTSISEFRDLLGISNRTIMSYNLDINTFLTYLEYVINILSLMMKKSRQENREHITPIQTNIKILLTHFNYKIYEIDSDRVKYIVIEDNPHATAVAEMVDDDDISRDIIKYNHFMLKGNVYEKKKILTQLYKEYEKIKGSIKYEGLKNDLGFIFNSLGIRHDKGDNKTTNRLVQTMTDPQIEEWCDRVYELFLAAELLVNYLNFTNKISWLKTGIKQGEA